jgi:hypothetical protein
VRRPLPPELVLLGDQLEVAARHAIGRRRTRRHMILNVITALAVTLPLVVGALETAGNVVVPAPAPVADWPAYGLKADDVPPRFLHRANRPSEDALSEDGTLRRALR